MDISDEARRSLIAAYSQMDVWQDVKPALERLKAKGIRLVFLSNLSEKMLLANMANAGITALFEPPLSTDRVKKFKPAPAAYTMATDALNLKKNEIGFAAFGGWDAVGATWFGYRTVWSTDLECPESASGPRRPSLVAAWKASLNWLGFDRSYPSLAVARCGHVGWRAFPCTARFGMIPYPTFADAKATFSRGREKD